MDASAKDTKEELIAMDAPPRANSEMISSLVGERYKYGFVTNIESETAPKGLNEEIIRYISAMKG